MSSCTRLCLTLIVICFSQMLQAAEPGELPTLLTQRTKLVLRDALDQAPAKPWVVSAPEWTAVDGAWRAEHRKPFPDHHGPVIQHPLDVDGVVVQLRFKVAPKTRATLHLNKQKGHLCRALMTPDAFYLIRRDSGGDKGARLDERAMTLAPDVWHTLVLEACGRELSATLDGTTTLLGERDDLDVTKTMLILESAAGTAWFQDLRVWQAEPNPAWPATKIRLTAEREKK